MIDFEKLSSGCPWKDNHGFCVAHSCIGWGGHKCEQSKCAVFYFVATLYPMLVEIAEERKGC